MKKTIFIILIALGHYHFLNAQSILDFGKFPFDESDSTAVSTSELLNRLNWKSLKVFCDSTEGHYARVYQDSLIAEYQYTKQGAFVYFKIRSFKGKVMSFNSEISENSKPTYTDYFDKNVWLSYSHTFLPEIPDSFKINSEIRKDILIAYYQLLGVDTRDEYGWICEYATVGRPPGRRIATINLRLEENLLLRLLDYPNIQTQLYAADALIFTDYETRQMIKEAKESDFKKYLKSKLLSKATWEKIFEIRDSNMSVRICGNMSSYKVYPSSTKELLSEEAINEIPKKYERLSDVGYFKLGYKIR